MRIFPASHRTQSTPPAAWEVAMARRVAARLTLGSRLQFGVPVRCPRCHDYGLIEDVDERRGVSSHRCVGCGAEWLLTRRGIDAVNRERAGVEPAVDASRVTLSPVELSRTPRVAHFTDAA